MRPSSLSPASLAGTPRSLRRWLPAALLLAGGAVPLSLSALQIDLRWADNSSNESGFRIERSVGTGSYAQIASTGANVTQYTDSNVTANSMYHYRVKAYNSTGVSAYSNTASVSSGGTSGNTAPTISAISDRTISVNGTTGAIGFTIGDAQTSASSLTLTKNASNTSLVPLGNITFGGSGANRTVTVKPAANKSGWSTIWVKVSDGSLSKYIGFTLTVKSGGSSGGNTAPTITAISDRTIAVNGSTGTIGFTIGDAQTSASSLTLIKNASNTSLVPLNNITFGGSGANRTVTVKPAANKSGWSTIWVKVSDGSLSKYIGFTLTVKSGGSSGGNTAPTITAIPDQRIAINGSTGPIPFSIGDAQTAASSLTLIRNVSNSSVIPLYSVSFGGSGANRTVTVRPAWNRTGWSTVWVKVSDGQLDRYVSFTVSVGANLAYTSIEPAAVMTYDTSSTTSSSLAAGSTTGPSSEADQLRFGHLNLSGDTELTVHVDALQGTDDAIRGGLMYRDSVAADAVCAGVYVTGSGRILFVSRGAQGGELQTSAPLQGTAPQWLRLVRSGDDFYGFTSADGKTWDLVDFATVTMPDTVLAGTAAEAPGGATEETATFSTFSVD